MATQFEELEKKLRDILKKHDISQEYGGDLLIDEARFYCHDIAAKQGSTYIMKDFPDTIKTYFQFYSKKTISNDKLNEILADIHEFSESNAYQLGLWAKMKEAQLGNKKDEIRNRKCDGKTAGQASRGDWRF